jgi:hypothetical protein
MKVRDNWERCVNRANSPTVDKHYADGMKTKTYADGMKTETYADGMKTGTYADGMKTETCR